MRQLTVTKSIFLVFIILASVDHVPTWAQSPRHSQPPPATKEKIVTSDQTPKFAPGEGGKYKMVNGTDQSEVVIFFLESNKDSVIFEVHMKSLVDNAALNIDMTQQFHLKLAGGTLQLVKGIIKIPHIDKPQILPVEALSGLGSMQVQSFLIGSKNDLGGQNVGLETITENNNTFKTTHYRKSEGGQTLDYWISDEVKPMGLVRMKSVGSKSSENYSMQFLGTVSGLKSRLNAAEAVPLSTEAQMFLPLLTGGLSK